MNKKIESTSVQDDVYQKGKLHLAKTILLFSTVLCITILSNLSISDKLISAVETGIGSLRGCPISYSGIEFSWFPPSLSIKSPELGATCFGGRQSNRLELRNTPISLSFPSVYPPGIKLHTQLWKKKSNTKINIYPTFAFGKTLLKITDTVVGHDLLTDIIGSEIIKGSLDIESIIEIVNGSPTAGDILIKSKNLNIPKQTISGLTIPELKINNLQLKGSLLKSKIKVISFLIGDETSPIVANFKGTIRLNKYNIKKSKLNLTGDIKFSQELLAAFPIINMLVIGKENQGGFYRVKLTGPLSSPKPQIL
ncbi:MAG: hypothetical protein KAG61_10600 [Bacteriovoracaceae bacterium]|nr:hypothetical protein [Bacteriovoracaceae bacterium]